MINLYADPALAADYVRLIELARADSSSLDPSDMAGVGLEPFYRALATRVYASLQSISPEPLPQLHIHPSSGQAGTLARLDAETTFADQRGTHAGLGLVSKLDAAILVLSAYLMENFLWQVSPLEVDTPAAGEASKPQAAQIPFSLYTGKLPSIADVVGLNEFPAEALSLYAAHVIPEAEARDGYQKRPFQLLMEYLQENRSATGRGRGDRLRLTRAIPKALLDVVDFFDRLDLDMVMRGYLDPDRGPYLLRLHLQLLLDGLHFVLAHEVAHYQLGHLQHREAPVAQIRREEVAADMAALALLRGIPGFQARSLMIIFNFARHNEPAAPPDRMDHPLAHNRLLILAESLLAESASDALRADVNAGLALLPSRLEPQYLTFGWPDEAPEDVDIYLSSYGDMDYTAHVMVYLNRPPRHAGPEAASAENAFLLAHLAYKITFEVRDRVDPEMVYAWGGAGYHPTIRREDLYSANRAETVFSRLHLAIPAPPEFCLKWPGAEFAVKNIEIIVREPDLKGPEAGRNPIRFFYEPVALELGDFLRGLPPPGRDPALRRRLLLAARRYHDYDRGEAAVQIYWWLYRQEPDSLPYGDVVNLAVDLIASGRLPDAADIARWAVGPRRAPRPRFHYVLALDHAQRDEAQDAFEEAFLEMALFGRYGEMYDEARELSAQVMAVYSADPVMGALREFITHRDAAAEALERGQREDALTEFRLGRDAMLAGRDQSRGDFTFLRQLQSDIQLAIAELQGSGLEIAVEAAQVVLARKPDFVPALMNLAAIARLQGDNEAAYSLWQQAHALAPFHSVVFERREEFEHGLP